MKKCVMLGTLLAAFPTLSTESDDESSSKPHSKERLTRSDDCLPRRAAQKLLERSLSAEEERLALEFLTNIKLQPAVSNQKKSSTRLRATQ